ncbi:glycoside hydrolase family 5 protein [Nitratireductor pacificus]|uniref:Glycoside hydrolase family protein n=1 Tax=Nitratireductor pacificus pht-3B TaxID=391937 RepID=K2MM27_9HYPH|nr:cellulase family glycosylhydrolase [Nitratireductor pacificus]EKF18282.1 glycoside hydrolase family protein [Nitratireductor pacificus pht-3B]
MASKTKRLSGSPVAGLLAIAALLGCPASPSEAATFAPGRGVNLDLWDTWPNEADWSREGVLLPYPEWRRKIETEDLALLKGTGFDFVRMPVDPIPFLSPNARSFRDRLFGSVLEGVRAINAAGLKVIVDLHPIPRGADRFAGVEEILRDEALFERYLDLVREMGRTLSGEDPAQVAFELMNEPVTGCEGAEGAAWDDQLGRLFAAARASASRITLVLSGACWGSAEGLAALDPKTIPDDNILWGFHTYQPFLLTSQGALWAGDFIRYVTGIPYPPHAHKAELTDALEKARERIRSEAPLLRRAGMLAYLDEQIALIDTEAELEEQMAAPFRVVADWADTHAVDPGDIILSEFGMIRQEYENPVVMPGEWRAAYMRDMIGQAETRGFAWSIWGYGGAFGIVEEFGGRRAEDDVLRMIGTLGE